MPSRFWTCAAARRIPINELERVPRGELVIAANEATCIYVLPRVFSEYKKRFPNVQILVDRSYGARVVEAVVDNQADFGITQLPVKEKRLQVVEDSFRRDQGDGAGQTSAGAEKRRCCRRIWSGMPLLLPKTGHDAQPADRVAGAGGRRDLRISMELDSTEMIKRFVMAGLGVGFVRGRALPRRSGGRAAGGDLAGARSHGAPDWTNL